MQTEFVDVAWGPRRVRIEHAWLAREKHSQPLLVFLHEGLGSVAMWKAFPAQLCAALNCRGLVYSRPGYGQSTPRAPAENWGVDFLHQQALQVLPALLQALRVDAERAPLWLLGHSDGGSIALLFAAHAAHAAHAVAPLAGVIVLAPHILVEAVSIASIEAARQAYLAGDLAGDLAGGLRQRLARFHADPDSAFWGWNRIWLDPAFRPWSIEDEIGRIRCPLLAVQGLGDEYGTLEQVRGIQRRVPHTQLLEMAHCGHSPQRDQGPALIAAIQAFFSNAALNHRAITA